VPDGGGDQSTKESSPRELVDGHSRVASSLSAVRRAVFNTQIFTTQIFTAQISGPSFSPVMISAFPVTRARQPPRRPEPSTPSRGQRCLVDGANASQQVHAGVFSRTYLTALARGSRRAGASLGFIRAHPARCRSRSCSRSCSPASRGNFDNVFQDVARLFQQPMAREGLQESW